METRREERIGQLLQELKRSDKLHLRRRRRPAWGFRDDDSSRSEQPQCARRFARRLYCSGTAQRQPLPVKRSKIPPGGRKTPGGKTGCDAGRTRSDPLFDCGTTTPWIIEAIDNEIPFTAVCYSLNTFLALKEKPHCRAFLCGGEFHASNAIFKPIDFQQTLNNFCPDIAFYSAAGVHVSKGATCFNLEELPVKHWAMSMAQKHVLVVDHSKFGKVRPARMGDLKRFDIVVSDCCPEDEYVKYAQTQRIKLMY